MAPAVKTAWTFMLYEKNDTNEHLIMPEIDTGIDQDLSNYSDFQVPTTTMKTAATVLRPVYYHKKMASVGAYNSTRTHEEQVQAFFFTVIIIMFYALTILYFMLKQICRQVSL